MSAYDWEAREEEDVEMEMEEVERLLDALMEGFGDAVDANIDAEPDDYDSADDDLPPEDFSEDEGEADGEAEAAEDEENLIEYLNSGNEE